MTTKDERLVNMEHVIGELAHEHGIPILTMDQLTLLGQRAVQVYGLTSQAKTILFADLCEYIKAFISTIFGLKILKEIQQNIY